jgi:hypothetical protein
MYFELRAMVSAPVATSAITNSSWFRFGLSQTVLLRDAFAVGRPGGPHRIAGSTYKGVQGVAEFARQAFLQVLREVQRHNVSSQLVDERDRIAQADALEREWRSILRRRVGKFVDFDVEPPTVSGLINCRSS